MAAVLAVNVAEVDPAPTETEVGAVRVGLLLVTLILAPPVGAAPFSVTVHVELLEGFNVAGRHLRELMAGKLGPEAVTLPPVVVSGRAEPAPEAATPLITL